MLLFPMRKPIRIKHPGVLASLLEAEIESRSIAAQRCCIRSATFPQLKYLHDLIREELPEQAGAALPELETLDFVSKGRNLVICDEFGYVSCDKEGAELLFNHLSLRVETRSTIITTNMAFSRWNEIIPDKVLVNALVDRLTHKAKIINMTGTSFRLKQTQQMIKNQI